MGAGDQHLPTDEEVIICDEKTTAEEVNKAHYTMCYFMVSSAHWSRTRASEF